LATALKLWRRFGDEKAKTEIPKKTANRANLRGYLVLDGADGRIRTADLLITNQLLYH
jgi:hypothetical protein